MAYNRYRGNTGRFERVADVEEDVIYRGSSPGVRLPRGNREVDSAPEPSVSINGIGEIFRGGFGDLLGGLGDKLNPSNFETEDILLMMILYLMYRESGDLELLIILGAMVLL